MTTHRKCVCVCVCVTVCVFVSERVSVCERDKVALVLKKDGDSDRLTLRRR
jgi:hypothetical protein